MKQALERLVDAKRVLMRDSDQYVIMNFAMIEEDQPKIKELKGTKDEEKLHQVIFQKEVNIQIMFQLLQNFNRNNLSDLLERKKNAVDVVTTRKNLKVLLQTLQEKLVKTDLDLGSGEDDEDEIRQLSSMSQSSLDLEEPFTKIGRDTRYNLMSNFCMELGFLLLDKKKTKANTMVSEFRHIFVYQWFVMLQTFIDRRSVEL